MNDNNLTENHRQVHFVHTIPDRTNISLLIIRFGYIFDQLRNYFIQRCIKITNDHGDSDK